MNIIEFHDHQRRQLVPASGRMAEALIAMRVPDELQVIWNASLDTAAKCRILEAETDRPGHGLAAMWRELLAVESCWRCCGA